MATSLCTSLQFTFYKLANCFSQLTNTTGPQNLETIYEALRNSGDVGEEDNRKDENKVHIVKTDIKSQVLLEVDELRGKADEHKTV